MATGSLQFERRAGEEAGVWGCTDDVEYAVMTEEPWEKCRGEKGCYRVVGERAARLIARLETEMDPEVRPGGLRHGDLVSAPEAAPALLILRVPEPAVLYQTRGVAVPRAAAAAIENPADFYARAAAVSRVDLCPIAHYGFIRDAILRSEMIPRGTRRRLASEGAVRKARLHFDEKLQCSPGWVSRFGLHEARRLVAPGVFAEHRFDAPEVFVETEATGWECVRRASPPGSPEGSGWSDLP